MKPPCWQILYITICGGLNKNGCHRFLCLNSWFPASGLFRSDCLGQALEEEVYPWR